MKARKEVLELLKETIEIQTERYSEYTAYKEMLDQGSFRRREKFLLKELEKIQREYHQRLEKLVAKIEKKIARYAH